jgi:GNAT superfamily N-acetyltransferase
MNNIEILEIAMRQSAVDANCHSDDFRKSDNVVVISRANPGARKYLSFPFYCNLISYGSNIVASVDHEIAATVSDFVNQYPAEHCFETPNLHVLNDELEKRKMRICFMAEYFLPDMNLLEPLQCSFTTKALSPDDFASLYLAKWSNALCEKRKQLDMMAIGAFDGDKLVGLAGCSADCDTMWQIGVDVLPEYRRKGIAAALTSRLAVEVIDRGIVPFYCSAWSNIRSVRNAMKSGFRPAWVEMTAKSLEFVTEMNRQYETVIHDGAGKKKAGSQD